MNVKIAFLNGFMEYTLYMAQLGGFVDNKSAWNFVSLEIHL